MGSSRVQESAGLRRDSLSLPVFHQKIYSEHSDASSHDNIVSWCARLEYLQPLSLPAQHLAMGHVPSGIGQEAEKSRRCGRALSAFREAI